MRRDDFQTEKYEELLRLMNPDTLKENLVRAAVYIIAYEFLENLLKDHLESFYVFEEGSLEHWMRTMKFKPGKKYKEEVMAKEKDDPLIASCRWFEESNVLTSDDTEFIRAAREHRCELVHEMGKVLIRSGEQVDIRGLKRICELAYRVDEWWLVNREDASAGSHSLGAMLLRYFTEIVTEDKSPPGGLPEE